MFGRQNLHIFLQVTLYKASKCKQTNTKIHTVHMTWVTLMVRGRPARVIWDEKKKSYKEEGEWQIHKKRRGINRILRSDKKSRSKINRWKAIEQRAKKKNAGENRGGRLQITKISQTNIDINFNIRLAPLVFTFLFTHEIMLHQTACICLGRAGQNGAF